MWICYRVSEAVSCLYPADNTDPLFVVLQRDLEFLGRNKEYTRTILRDEARATYSVLRQWPDLCPDKQGVTVRSMTYYVSGC